MFRSIDEQEKTKETPESSSMVKEKEQDMGNIRTITDYIQKNGSITDIDKHMASLNKKQRRILSREYARQGNSCYLRNKTLYFCFNLIDT